MSRLADPTAKISLLRAAEAVFAEHGLAAAKVEEITRRAGLSKGSFYSHFESKEEAFKQVVESFLARLTAIYPPPQASADVPSTPEAVVAFWLERDEEIFEFLWQNRSIVTILAGCQGSFAYLLDTFRQTVHETTKRWIEHSQAQKLLRADLDSDLLATLLGGAYHELSLKMMTFDRRPPIAEWLAQALSLFLRGMGTARVVQALADSDRAVSHVSPSGSLRASAGRRSRV